MDAHVKFCNQRVLIFDVVNLACITAK